MVVVVMRVNVSSHGADRSIWAGGRTKGRRSSRRMRARRDPERRPARRARHRRWPRRGGLPGRPDCGESPFECTTVDVPVDRSGGVPGTIPLYVERSPGGGRDAIFALAGGPGQGNSSVTLNFNADLAPILTGDRYLVVFDQRGTGRSEALNCPELERPGPSARSTFARRRAPSGSAERAHFTTRDSVEDLEAVRQRIGDDRITIYGVSYGTKVAVAYALKYPQHVDRLILDSVVEPEGQNPFDVDTFAAMPRVMREICRGECGSFTNDFAATSRRWRSGCGRRRCAVASPVATGAPDRADDGARPVPAHARGRPGRTGARRIPSGDQVGASGRSGAAAADRAPLRRPARPDRRARAAGGRAGAQLQPLHRDDLRGGAAALGPRTASPEERLRQARERAAAMPDSAFAPFDRETALTLDGNSLLLQCSRWPAAAEAPALAPGPPPDVPVLVLEGQEDLRTPLEAGTAGDPLPARAVASVPKTAHGVLGARGAPCASAIVRRWFADRPVGTPCAKARRQLRVQPQLPRRLSDVRPARGIRGTRGRDGRRRWRRSRTSTANTRSSASCSTIRAAAVCAAAAGCSAATRSGLRASRSCRVDRQRHLRGIDRPSGRLTIGGSAASRGTLRSRVTASCPDALAGAPVRVRFTVPRPAGGEGEAPRRQPRQVS